MSPKELQERAKLAAEAAFHDERVESEEGDPSHRLNYVYRSLEPFTFETIKMLPQAGSVLEVGCYTGTNSQYVTDDVKYLGIDISPKAIEVAEVRARTLGKENLKFLVHDANTLDTLNSQYDYIFGNGVLHHLDLEKCIPSLKKALSPSGVAVFVEPLAGPFWLRAFRSVTPQLRTPDEHPFTGADLARFESEFAVSNVTVGLAAPLLPMLFLNNRWVSEMALKLDLYLKRWLPIQSFWLIRLELRHK